MDNSDLNVNNNILAEVKEMLKDTRTKSSVNLLHNIFLVPNIEDTQSISLINLIELLYKYFVLNQNIERFV